MTLIVSHSWFMNSVTMVAMASGYKIVITRATRDAWHLLSLCCQQTPDKSGSSVHIPTKLSGLESTPASANETGLGRETGN